MKYDVYRPTTDINVLNTLLDSSMVIEGCSGLSGTIHHQLKLYNYQLIGHQVKLAGANLQECINSTLIMFKINNSLQRGDFIKFESESNTEWFVVLSPNPLKWENIS